MCAIFIKALPNHTPKVARTIWYISGQLMGFHLLFSSCLVPLAKYQFTCIQVGLFITWPAVNDFSINIS